VNIRSSDLYLNALCLAAYAPGNSTVKIASAVVGMFDDLSRDERTMLSPLNLLYVKLLREISVGNLDLSNRAEASGVLLKYQDDKAFESNKVTFKELQNLLLPDVLPAPQKIRVLFNRVKNNITFFKTNNRIRKMLLSSQRVGSEDDIEKQNALFKEILASAESIRSEIEDTTLINDEVVAQVDEIDMTNPESIKKALAAQRKKRNGVQIKFGLQGLNRMMGPSKGVAYGSSFACAARSHNYKSGLLMDITRWQATLNTPPDTNGQTPVILFISLENEIAENLMDWYKKLFANMYHKMPYGFKDDEVVEFVMRKMSSNGFKLLVYRKMGESFGYREFVELVDRLEKSGCKVVSAILDYVTLCKRCPEDKTFNDPKQIQLMFARFKDYCAHKDMFFCTGLQLETEASKLAASGQTNIVKRYNESHLSDSKSLKKELDLLMFLEIEHNHKGVPFLTMKIDKHRYVLQDTPIEDRYCAYKYLGELGILDDINGKDMSVKDIYSDNDDDSSDVVSVF
jgi:hypothetical protein